MPPTARESLRAGPLLSLTACEVSTVALRSCLENAVDAGAVNICVRLQRDGLVVEDDGCGISPASMALLGTRYASSKPCLANSSRSSQLGYRGEALASIAQVVRRVQLISRAVGHFETCEAIFGPHQQQRHGLCSPQSLQHTAGGPGTRVEVTGFSATSDVQRSRHSVRYVGGIVLEKGGPETKTKAALVADIMSKWQTGVQDTQRSFCRTLKHTENLLQHQKRSALTL